MSLRPSSLSRRRFLLGTGAAATTLAATPGTAERRRPSHGVADVAVIGAGFAGLAAARALEAAGASVVVIEARDRVGGRTLNAPLTGGKVIEVGGQWIGPTQTEIMALATEVGVDTYKTYNDGDNILYFDGVAARYPSTGLPPVPDTDLNEFLAGVLGDLGAISNQVPLDAPWTVADALALDGQTVESWKVANLGSAGARFLLDIAVESVFACEPRDLSLLHFLFYLRSGGGLLSLITTGGGAQDSRFVGGSQLVAEKAADALSRKVVFRSPVRRIVTRPHDVLIETDRRKYRAGAVICALAPTLCGRIEYDTPLPSLRDQLTQRVPQGSVIKCEAVYASPFWRDAGLSGQVVSDTGPVKITFDNTPQDGSPGVLLGFLEGAEARLWGTRTMADRRQAVLESFARYFGAAALTPTDYIEHDWSADQWTRGCYAGFMPPGVLTGYGPALREPIGALHWAGTETAEVWNGYIDGAVRSGKRAAAEIMGS